MFAAMGTSIKILPMMLCNKRYKSVTGPGAIRTAQSYLSQQNLDTLLNRRHVPASSGRPCRGFSGFSSSQRATDSLDASNRHDGLEQVEEGSREDQISEDVDSSEWDRDGFANSKVTSFLV